MDGVKAFHCRRMGMRLAPDWPMDRIRELRDMPADTHTVADFLTGQGVNARAYSGETKDEERQTIERQLLADDVKVVVATSALGMGFDKPNLGFVVHYQTPTSPIAYYQQVGRAGRGPGT